MKFNSKILLGLSLLPLIAWQTYVPPPPPKLPEALSEKMIQMGKSLFEENILRDHNLEIYNYLGSRPCSACHDKPNKLSPDHLAKNFKEVRTLINREITKRLDGSNLPPQDLVMERRVQYLIQKYQLQDYK